MSDVDKPPAEQSQLLHYELGVGTSRDDRLIGGAFGYGLSRNIRNGYQFLATNYVPGDRVFLFGFSRGAYTARSLAGLIHRCGILRSESADKVDDAFAFYRDRTSATDPKSVAAHLFRQMYAHADSRVYLIGVWDTVGALGIPANLPGWERVSREFSGWEELWGFHDTRLSPEITFAYHALAIDEQRPPYQPTLWDEDAERTGDQVLEQVWFAGVHSEVGGGSADSSLSDIALLWMAGKAAAQGLQFVAGQPLGGTPELGVPAPAPNYAGPLIQSRSGPWALLHPYHRLTQASIIAAPKQAVAPSAAQRFHERVDGYSPPGLDQYLRRLQVGGEQ